MWIDLAREALALLKTPTGAISLVAALLAGGIAIREYRGRGRRNGNDNGKTKQVVPIGEHTGDMLKDLKALGAGPGSQAEVITTDVVRLEGRLEQLSEQQREDQEFLQRQITELSSDVALCNRGLEENKQALSDARRDIPIDTARRVLGALRKSGVESLPERRKRDVPVPAERRRPDPGEKAG